MIRHIAMFRWTADATAEQKQAVADELAALTATMPWIRGYTCGPDLGLVTDNFDFAVSADFDDEAGYFAYRDEPAHHEVIKHTISPIMAQRVAVQFSY
jgi:hypothetical protein